MSTLSQTQIKIYAAAAGFTNPTLMSAIAMAESSGSTTVVNSIGCVGLWQINQPVWVKSHPSWTKAWLQDPAHNAAAAKVIYDAQGLNAWEAYTNGAYSKYYPSTSSTVQAQDASVIGDITGIYGKAADSVGGLIAGSVPGGSSIVSTVDNTAEAIGSASKALWAAGKWISVPYNWLRIAFVVGGGVLTLVGVNMAIEGTLFNKIGGGSGGTADTLIGLVPGGGAAKTAIKGLAASSKSKTPSTPAPAKKTAAPSPAPKSAPPKGSSS